MPTIIWLGIFVILVILEIGTMALTTIWFAGGALVAFIASLFHIEVLTQIIIFLIVSFVLLLCTRPIAIKYINKGHVKTNVDSLVGEQAKVTEQINNINDTGVVVLNGLEWTARTQKQGIIIPVNAIVTIEKIEGVKLIVRPTLKEEL